jgi:hypothetical protein
MAACEVLYLFIKRVADGETLTLEVEADLTIKRLKLLIEGKSAARRWTSHLPSSGGAAPGIRPAQQWLSFNGMDMVGERTLADYKLHPEAEIKLEERAQPPHAEEQGSMAKQLEQLELLSGGLHQRWAQVSASGRALSESKQALLQANGGGQLKKKLKLNIGGTIFSGVKRETLCAVPESHLAQLFSGRWEERLLRDSKGRIFLDVHPECFGKILSFLSDRVLRPEEPIGMHTFPPTQPVAASVKMISLDRTTGACMARFAVLPGVPDELQPALYRLLDFFGLGHLFVGEEGVPPGAEPALGRADHENAPVAESEDATEETVLVVAENDSVELPPRSIDEIIEAR